MEELAPLLAERYQITQRLGAGRHGRVFQALDTQHGRHVVLKITPIGADERADVLAEARVMLSLAPHPCLPLIRDDFFYADDHVLVLDTVAGTSLAELLDTTGDPGLGPSSVLSYLDQLASALDHLHRNTPTVVHGDVNPANCIVTADGHVVLVDFGTADGARREGTHGFVAPEVAAGGDPSPASDVFSLAATALTLVSGAPPTGGTPDLDGVDDVRAGGWIRGLRRGLAVDPELRPRSAGELVDRLRHALGELPGGLVTFLVAGLEPLEPPHGTDSAVARTTRRRNEDAAARIAESHGGHFLGSRIDEAAWVMVFAEAHAAVRASAEIAGIAEQGWPVRGVGLATGEAGLVDGRYYGQALPLAAAVGALAHKGQVVATAATSEIVPHGTADDPEFVDLGDHRLSSIQVSVRLFQLGAQTHFPSLRSIIVRDEHNLPAEASRFVGRAQELKEVADVLTTARLVTLTGAGGVGKTRLALAAATQVIGTVRDGVWLVELASLTEPDLVVSAIARALNVELNADASPLDAAASLVEALRNRRLLLVLDNCEHVIEACADIATAVSRGCPAVRLLATSRVPLHVDGEHVWHVPVMGLPDGTVVSRREAVGSDAVELFEARVRSYDAAFAVDNRNVTTVVSICQRLDALPLAIELAAARLRTMGLPELEERLDARFELLSSQHRDGVPHHQTLWATIDWSYQLLPDNEQAMFRRLAACPGIFDLATAEAVGAGVDSPSAGAAILGSLVDKSLVQMEHDQFGARYRMLETIRHFAAQRLGEDTVERGEATRRFALHVLAFAEAPHRNVALHPEAFAHLTAEMQNIETALAFFCGAIDPLSACRLFCAVGYTWFYHRRQALRSLTQILGLDLDDVPDTLRVATQTLGLNVVPYSQAWYRPLLEDTVARAVATGDPLAVLQARFIELTAKMDVDKVDTLADLAALTETARALDDRPVLHLCLLQMGIRGDAEPLRELLDVGGTLLVGEAHYQLASRLTKSGQLDEALAHLDAGEDFYLRYGFEPYARPTDYRGDLQLRMGLVFDALKTYVEAFRFECRIGRANTIAVVALKLGSGCVAVGEYRMAALLLGFSDAQRKAFGTTCDGDETRVRDGVTSELGAVREDVQALQQEGAGMLVGDMLDRVFDWYEAFATQPQSTLPASPVGRA